jgi:nucleotide-binding universal stress UspA family protein
MRPLIRRIVAGVATLRTDDPALVSAVRLAGRLNAELHLVHVRDGPHPPDAPAVFETRLDLEELAAAADPAATALRVTCHVVDGRAEDRLREIAAESDADVLVLGATRRGMVAGAVLGTTAGHLLRSVHIPILVVRGAFPDPPARVLLTTDLSHHAVYAHSRGAALATALCAPGTPELRSLFVDQHFHEDWAIEPVVRADPEDELRAFLEAEEPRTPTAPSIRSGDPASEIVSAAKDWQADLLVMGTHGRHGPLRLLLGSVAETVLRHAPCATVVIPPPRPREIAADHARATSAAAASVDASAPVHTGRDGRRP